MWVCFYINEYQTYKHIDAWHTFRSFRFLVVLYRIILRNISFVTELFTPFKFDGDQSLTTSKQMMFEFCKKQQLKRNKNKILICAFGATGKQSSGDLLQFCLRLDNEHTN